MNSPETRKINCLLFVLFFILLPFEFRCKSIQTRAKFQLLHTDYSSLICCLRQIPIEPYSNAFQSSTNTRFGLL